MMYVIHLRITGFPQRCERERWIFHIIYIIYICTLLFLGFLCTWNWVLHSIQWQQVAVGPPQFINCSSSLQFKSYVLQLILLSLIIRQIHSCSLLPSRSYCRWKCYYGFITLHIIWIIVFDSIWWFM